MCRALAADGATRERRRQLTHPTYVKPELLATAPKPGLVRDITKLKGPVKWTCFHLYVILDIFSRQVVGWLIAERESAELAEQLIAESVSRHDIAPGTLTLHADRGASMRSKPVAALLVDLDITKSHSRPHVSDDNPLLGIAVQDDEVPPGLPRALRQPRRRPCPLPDLLRLVQHRAPALGHRLHDARAASTMVTGAARALQTGPGRRLLGQPETIQGAPP